MDTPGSSYGPDGASPTPYFIDRRERSITPLHQVDPDNWDRILSEVKSQRITRVYAAGKMTDSVLEQISHLNHVTALHLDGSRQLTDEGLQHLANMPQLQVLELGGDITDKGLESLRHLTQLRKFQMCWQTRVSDAGIANLSFCDQIESVNLLGSTTGDGAILALVSKSRLRHLTTGREVTDAGLLHLHRNSHALRAGPAARRRNSLMTASAEPINWLSTVHSPMKVFRSCRPGWPLCAEPLLALPCYHPEVHCAHGASSASGLSGLRR